MMTIELAERERPGRVDVVVRAEDLRVLVPVPLPGPMSRFGAPPPSGIRCAACGREMARVPGPEGHGDHEHVRCAACSPPTWSACVRVG